MLSVLSVPRFDKIPLPSDSNGTATETGTEIGVGDGIEVGGVGMEIGTEEGVGGGGGMGGRDHTISSHNEAGGLHCAMYLPNPDLHGPGPYPTIVSVYGGPGPQRVSITSLLLSCPTITYHTSS